MSTTAATPEAPAIGLHRYQQYVDGQLADALDGRSSTSEDPTHATPWAVVPDSSPADVDAAVRAARRAFDDGPWPRMLPQERARHLRRLAELVERDGARAARAESRDNGKLLAEQTLQWVLLAELLWFWAGAADKINGTSIPSPLPLDVSGLPIPEAFAYTRREPIGVVAAILPWNSPAGQLGFKFGPAMAAGCTMVAKPSEHAPVSLLEFGRLVAEAGFPPGVFNVVSSQDREVGAALVVHPMVDKISFTGSTATGQAILRAAAANVTDVTAELGGKSAAVVFADADLDRAVAGVAAGIFAAAGQTCMACSRVYVEDAVHDEFVARLSAYADAMVVGDPTDPATQMGPLANAPNHRKVMSYLELGPQEGVTVVAGGGPAETGLGGRFVRPTVFTGVGQDMRVAREEIFGPVASVMRVTGEAEAVARANDSSYGLAAGVFTGDPARAHRVAHQLRAGTVWINSYRLVTHLAPFGGYGQSGTGGRENGLEGVDAYLETKAVWVPTQ